MPHDRNGKPIEKGDEVLIRATVVDVYAGEKLCNANFRVVDPADLAADGEYIPSLTFNTRLVEKVEK